jgi:alpha-beta hydrolase superfamily lysophospholipase
MLTVPSASARQTAVLLVSFGSGNRYNLHGLLGQRLAARGFPVLCMDLKRHGESTGAERPLSLYRLGTRDVHAAVAELGRRGFQDVAIVGKCFCARSALAAASRLPRVRGLVLVSTPLAAGNGSNERLVAPTPGALRSLLDRRRRRGSLRGMYHWLRDVVERPWPPARIVPVDPGVRRQLDAVVRRGVPLLLVHGTADPDFHELRRAQAGRLGDLLCRAGDRAEILTIDGYLHRMWTYSAQAAAATAIADWLERV